MKKSIIFYSTPLGEPEKDSIFKIKFLDFINSSKKVFEKDKNKILLPSED